MPGARRLFLSRFRLLRPPCQVNWAEAGRRALENIVMNFEDVIPVVLRVHDYHTVQLLSRAPPDTHGFCGGSSVLLTRNMSYWVLVLGPPVFVWGEVPPTPPPTLCCPDPPPPPPPPPHPPRPAPAHPLRSLFVLWCGFGGFVPHKKTHKQTPGDKKAILNIPTRNNSEVPDPNSPS